MMKSNSRYRVLVYCITIVLAVTWLFGCRTLPDLSNAGRVIPPEKRIPLAHDGMQKGQWTAGDLTLTYQYEQTGNRFMIAGTVDFAAPLRTGFSTLDYFFLKIVFVGDAGTVLTSYPLLTVGYGRPIDTITFRRDITLPSNTAAMAFGFRGRAREGGNGRFGGGSDAIEWNFQKIPY